MLGASPHSHDAMTKRSTLPVKSRTWPKRCVSHPVSGTEMPLATANEVITQVPWEGLTPMSPAIAGIDTFAIEVSSTFMNVASDSAKVPSTRSLPASGGYSTCCAGAAGGGEAAALGGPGRAAESEAIEAFFRALLRRRGARHRELRETSPVRHD